METAPAAVNSAQGNQEDSGVSGCCPISIRFKKSHVRKPRPVSGATPVKGKAKATVPALEPYQKRDPPPENRRQDVPPQPNGDNSPTDTIQSTADKNTIVATSEYATQSTGEPNALNPSIANNTSTESTSWENPVPKTLTTPRLEAEKRYNDAVQKLRKIVEEVKPGSFTIIPDAVSSQDQQPTGKVHLGTAAKQLEMAMATFIEGRRAQEESRSAVSKFVTKCYQTSFPIIKAGFKIVTVRTQSSLSDFDKDTISSPYGAILNGLMAVLKVLNWSGMALNRF